MTFDPFAQFGGAPGMPARQAFAIVPGDPLPALPAVIFVGRGGDVTLRAVDSETDVTYRDVPGGTYLTVRAAEIRAAGTTATDLIGEI